MFIKLIKVNGNNKKPVRSGEEIRFLSLIKLPLPGMAFAVPLCGEPVPALGEEGWVSGRTCRCPSGHNNPEKPLRSREQLLTLEVMNLQRSSGKQLLPGEPVSPPLSQTGPELGLSGGIFSSDGAALTLLPDESLQLRREQSEAGVSHPGDLLPWPGSGGVGGTGTQSPPLGPPLQRCFLMSPCWSPWLRTGLTQWQSTDQSFSPFPRLKLYFMQAYSVILLKPWPSWKIIKHSSRLFLNMQDKEKFAGYLLYSAWV